jgi:hypothetical protein
MNAHPYFETAREQQNASYARGHAITAIVSNHRAGHLGTPQAIEQLRRQDCYEAEIVTLLEG